MDQFIKHSVAHRTIVQPATGSLSYLRYSDDFALIHRQKEYLLKCVGLIYNFLQKQLRISLHSGKIILKPYHQGVDFLGFVCFPHFRILRTKTKQRMIRRFNKQNASSYFGLLKHCRSYDLQKQLKAKLFYDEH